SGYGLNPPTKSVIFLDNKMTSFIYYNNDNNLVNGNPRNAREHYNFMRGYWRNNTPATYGGNGTDQQNPPFKYMFPGDPLTQTGWSENNTLTNPTVNIPADRRGVGSIGPFSLAAGQEYEFTVAYNFTAGTPTVNSVTQARQDAQTVQNFFNGNLLATSKPVQTRQPLRLYPNPATDQMTVQLPTIFSAQEVTVQILDNTGRLVLTKTTRQTGSPLHLDISSLSKSIYQVAALSGSQTITGRLVKL
ncbi:MAG TPA: T9SS type A sorting domain-containing protein, partial [Adhaeribacter sp.]|nr:T9SS type A sorting domain-containing protein [Adhaeribacter sp.]